MNALKMCVGGSVFVVVATAAQAQNLSYKIYDLGLLSGYGGAALTGINNFGQVSGEAVSSIAGYSAEAEFVSTYQTVVTNNGWALQQTFIPPIGNRDISVAFGLNNTQMATGLARSSYGFASDAGFIYWYGVTSPIGTLGGSWSQGFAINDYPQVAGAAALAGDTASHACLFDGHRGTLLDLGTLGGVNSQAHGINQAGQVVGYSEIFGQSTNHAFIWTNGRMTDLGTLPGGGDSFALAVNDVGEVVGYSGASGDTVYHPFLYSNGSMVNLGSLGGTSNDAAESINIVGQVVGYSNNRAFLYTGGTMYDLNVLAAADPIAPSVTLTNATGINDDSWIAAGGIDSISNLQHAYLLVPYPSAPTSFVGAADNGEIDLSWVAPAITGNFAVTYNIYEGTSPGGEGAIPVAMGLTSPSAVISGLQDGTAYYFQVTAVSLIGEGTRSSEVVATPALAAPTGLVATPGYAQATLSWNAETLTGGYPITYNVYRGTTPGGESGTPILTGLTTPTALVTGLINGTTYYFTISAVSSIGTSTASAEASVKPVAQAPSVTVSLKPKTISAGSTSTLTWSATKATSCTASGAWSGPVALSGSQILTIPTAGSYVYTLSCTGTKGTTTKSATLTVK